MELLSHALTAPLEWSALGATHRPWKKSAAGVVHAVCTQVRGCTFTANSATAGDGGAIVVWGHSSGFTLRINSSSFTSCSAAGVSNATVCWA